MVALLNRPRLVILDELTQGLDPAARHGVWAAVDQLRQDGTTVLLVTHELAEAEALCDRVVAMRAGKVLDQGTPAELIARHAGQAIIRFTLPATDDTTTATALQQLNRLPDVQSVTRTAQTVTVRGGRAIIAHVGAWLAARPDPFTAGACIFARRQRVLLEDLHAAQAELARRARTDERHRIAREMHDLVGHSLTVTLLHLGSARLALDDNLDAARSSLAETEHAARNSLDDVRAAVGLLRTTDASSAPPAPAATDIADLVESSRRAGARIDLDVQGDLAALTLNRSLAAFRIVQESLTNAVRHGDGTPISVRIDILDDHARITVRNAAAARPPQVNGTGIAAMRERVGALGGWLAAGPDSDGWLVEAVIAA